MGAVFAVISADEQERKHVVGRLCLVSPHRGAVEVAFSNGQIVLGYQHNGIEAGAFVQGGLVCVVHGYVRVGNEFFSGGRAAHLLATAFFTPNSKRGAIDGCYCCVAYSQHSGELIIVRTWQNYLPLYCAKNHRAHVFATELRQVEAALDLNPAEHRLPRDAAYRSLLQQGKPVLSSQVSLVGAASLLRILPELPASGVSIKAYWPHVEEIVDPNLCGSSVIDAFLSFHRFASDADVYCLLSGGHDSALIAATAKAAQERGAIATVPSYLCAVFPGFDCDERDRIAWISQVYGIPSIDLVDLSRVASWEGFSRQLAILDHLPTATAGIVVELCSRISVGVGAIVMGGHGGDECFSYLSRHAGSRFSHLPSSMGRASRFIRMIRSLTLRVKRRVFGVTKRDRLASQADRLALLQYSGAMLLALEESLALRGCQYYSPYFDMTIVLNADRLMRNAFWHPSNESAQIKLIEAVGGAKWTLPDAKVFFNDWVWSGWPFKPGVNGATAIGSINWAVLADVHATEALRRVHQPADR